MKNPVPQQLMQMKEKNAYDKLRSDWAFYHLLKTPICLKRLRLDGDEGLQMDSTFLLGNFN